MSNQIVPIEFYDYFCHYHYPNKKYDPKVLNNALNQMKTFANDELFNVDQLIAVATRRRNCEKRNQKHLNNLRLLGGTDYESNYSCCRSDLSFSGKIII